MALADSASSVHSHELSGLEDKTNLLRVRDDFAFLLAEKVAGALGVTGNVVLSRLLGIVLAALAVQFVIDGTRMAIG